MNHKQNILWWLYLTAFLAVFGMYGCSSTPKEVTENDSFAVDSFKTEIPFATPEIIRMHETNLAREYHIGPGDEIQIDVWNRQKLSGEHLVGPYGYITLPMHGDFKIGGLNRFEAAKAIADIYLKYYDDPIATVKILKYLNNRVYVMGRVSNPGIIHFSGDGTLLVPWQCPADFPQGTKPYFCQSAILSAERIRLSGLTCYGCFKGQTSSSTSAWPTMISYISRNLRMQQYLSWVRSSNQDHTRFRPPAFPCWTH
ncbi:MAG: polysaccharide biosynthesis/export family protein [Deltaproteobacteria bacterium]|nr:polysaccharide biosynthesis/export family protein [Deltaproteobacteria bacterium]